MAPFASLAVSSVEIPSCCVKIIWGFDDVTIAGCAIPSN